MKSLPTMGIVIFRKKQFVKALFDAYQNRDLSAFLMEICGNSMFDLLRNAFFDSYEIQ